jgi:RNA polymerase sigma-70 factor (ECF subfamily)
MLIPGEATYLNAARAGDPEAFAQLMDPYRKQLLVHCYRILGSFEDAEDMLQETLIKAWRHLNSFEGRSSLRAWLYKIATNASLDALDTRRVRGLSNQLFARGDPTQALPLPSPEAWWIEPIPDDVIDDLPDIYPEARYELRESITLAFTAALQRLPGRQRAVLLLCDVMGWSSNEAAEILDTTTAAINSALQRARETLSQAEHKTHPVHLSEQLSTLLGRYVAAWESADSAALIALLREDVALTMPPLPVWFAGCKDIQTFLDRYLFRSAHPFKVRLKAVRANGSPAFAVYQADAQGIYRAAALHILTIENGQVTAINDYLAFDGQLFLRFHLDPAL